MGNEGLDRRNPKPMIKLKKGKFIKSAVKLKKIKSFMVN